jgi:exopolysaccharide biosynthesis polyprenyl glycosylphosphotransferase
MPSATPGRQVLPELPVGSECSGPGRSAAVPRRFLWLIDLGVLFGAAMFAYVVVPHLQTLFMPGGLLRFPWLEWLRLPPAEDHIERWPPFAAVLMFIVMAPSTMVCTQLLGGYRPLLEQSRTRMIVASLCAPLAGSGAIAVVLFVLKFHHVSRLMVFSFMLFSASGFFLYRILFKIYKRRRLLAGAYVEEIVLVGPTRAIEQLATYFDRYVPKTLYRVAGYLRVSQTQRVPFVASEGAPEGNAGAAAPMLPRLGDVSDLGGILICRPIHELFVVLAGSGQDDEWFRSVVETCDYFRVTLRVVPNALLTETFRDLTLPHGTGMLALPQVALTPRYLDSDALFVKRLFDISVSATALVALSPLFAVIAAAIKLTTPQMPVFYPWRVIGYKGRPFTGYKFTTMVSDAEARKDELMHLNEMTGPVFKIKDDPRVTRLGRFLRKFSLNELPQFWSVLKGDMSLVGPRPAGPHELPRYELWHKRKLAVQPGITCLWQVRGRNKISDFDDWVRMDLEYIDKWSLWLDIKILVWTVWVVAAGTGS